jgi:hypothetical protein
MELRFFITNIAELVAALSASYYWFKTKDLSVRYFMWLLWLTVFVETLGLYGFVLQNNYDNAVFIKLKNSVFCENRWLYNIYAFVGFIFLGLFYRKNLKTSASKKIVTFLIVLNSLFSIVYFSITNGFFVKSIPYDVAFQAFGVFVFVMLYLLELTRSDKILQFYKSYLFYISLGLLLWYLCITPLFIFDAYFYQINTGFVKFRNLYLLIANILLYSCYTFAFIYSSQYKEKLAQNK